MDNKKIFNVVFNCLTNKILRIRLENGFNLSKEELKRLLEDIKISTKKLKTIVNQEKRIYLFNKIALSLIKKYDKGSNMMFEVITIADKLSNKQLKLVHDLKKGCLPTKQNLTNENVLFLLKYRELIADLQVTRMDYVGDNYNYVDKYKAFKPVVYEIATDKLDQVTNIEEEIKQLKKTANKK